MATFDFLGLKKDLAPASERPPSGAPAPAKPGLSAKAWVALAAADLLAAAACGAFLYMRVGAQPELPAKPIAAKPAPKAAERPPEPAKPAEPAPKPEPPKAAPAKAEPAKAAKAEPSKVPLGSPSVHAAPPPQRQATPKGADAPKPAAPAKAASAARKSQTRPVPFSHTDPDAQEVSLMGPFLVRSGGRKTMFKDSKGVWTTTVYLNVGQSYKYRFEVAGPKGKKLTPTQKVEVLDGD
ncbi:MAG: hypothetical protein HY928_15190 [Elusimicrobia bacterium]|nr:hypothetical protein [Elusimicrobiota bacterium]